MKKVLVVLMVLGLATAANAGVTVLVEADGSYAVAGGTVDAYKVTLVADTSANKVTAFDVAFTGNMYQFGQYYPGSMANMTPKLGDAGIPTPAQMDSHFLLAAGDLTGVITPLSENNDWRYGMTSFLVGEGIGTQLGGASGLSLASQLISRPFANIAILRGSPDVLLNGSVANATGNKTYFTGVHIPEPATMLLLGLGGLGVISRRRRA